MSWTRRYHTLLGELGQIDQLITSLPSGDRITRASFTARQRALRLELDALAGAVRGLGEMAIKFDGGPVVGSRSIRLDFAGEVLSCVDDIVRKEVAQLAHRPLGERGPLPKLAQRPLHITSLVHGSMGFVIEEDDSYGQELIDSSINIAFHNFSYDLDAITSQDSENYEHFLRRVTYRLFKSFTPFFDSLFKFEASFNVELPDMVRDFGLEDVSRGYRRIHETNEDEEEIRKSGTLLGVIPDHRRFEFRTGDVGIIYGETDKIFTDRYLDLLARGEDPNGRVWEGIFRVKRLIWAGRVRAEKYTLVDLRES